MRLRRLLALALFVCSSGPAEVRTLTILHTNDLHARLTPLDSRRGGFAYVAAAIHRERRDCHDCILLNAGDLVQGSPVSTIFQGVPIYQIANLFGFDAATLGNHEFDYGWQQVHKFTGTANYPVVSANVVDPEGRLLTPRPYVILTANRLRIAVIGAMTDTLATLTTPKTVAGCRALPAVATARRYAAEVKPRSDLIVLLGHITAEEERAFLESAPEIPVFVTGHVHDGLSEPLTRDGRVLVRVKGYGEEIGRLELQVDTEKKAPVSFAWKRIAVDTAALTPDPSVAASVAHWEAEVTARVDVPLAVSRRAFTKSEVKALIERALRDETGSDFAHMNLEGVRDGLPAGQLLERHIWNIMPFENEVVVGSFKGRDLPPVVVGDRQIDPDRTYTLAVSDYTAANQQTDDNLGTTGLKFPKHAGLMRDMIIDWFRRQKIIQ